MGQTNSNRISHVNTDLPTTWRDDQLAQILNDIEEDATGKGYSEVYYVGATPFVDKLITWKDPAKTIKRSQVQFTYSPSPFISQIQKQIYADDGVTVVSTVTATVAYNANKTVQQVSVVNTRP